ncbi:glycosyltransferase family 4 protein [Streptomyces sp. SUK 48]|uniref:glycosyltransferase family 4 protein n=1 Tax=Streptomyces sp. SUK 48 TaxID=2582831 RepID=UPI00129B31DB|nr:glycosyltransferase family 4 protein [Streptomyces sp. SUK 48]
MTTLHGTDLKFLQSALDRVRRAAGTRSTVAELARREETAGTDAANLPGERWASWTHAEFWIQTLREHARISEHIVTVSEQDRTLAHELLHIPEARLEVIPNGVDTELFKPRPSLDETGKRSLLQHWLVEDPQGWQPGHGPGTITYNRTDVERMLRDDAGNRRPLLLWMGRFLNFKRLDLLLQVFAALRESAPVRPALLVLGGFPGEWEGEHPHTLAERLGILDDVYFAGWRPHGDLIDGLHASDLFVTPSVGEPFGLVCLEAMASATPVVATASGGPLATIRPDGPRPTGWLTAPADAEDLHATLLDTLTRPGEIDRRGRNARDFVVQHYSWPTIATRYAQMYDRVLASVPA